MVDGRGPCYTGLTFWRYSAKSVRCPEIRRRSWVRTLSPGPVGDAGVRYRVTVDNTKVGRLIDDTILSFCELFCVVREL